MAKGGRSRWLKVVVHDGNRSRWVRVIVHGGLGWSFTVASLAQELGNDAGIVDALISLGLAHFKATPHPALYTLHPTPCTLHPTPYTRHPSPYNLHPKPYTLHPNPHTLHPTGGA